MARSAAPAYLVFYDSCTQSYKIVQTHMNLWITMYEGNHYLNRLTCLSPNGRYQPLIYVHVVFRDNINKSLAIFTCQLCDFMVSCILDTLHSPKPKRYRDVIFPPDGLGWRLARAGRHVGPLCRRLRQWQRYGRYHGDGKVVTMAIYS